MTTLTAQIVEYVKDHPGTGATEIALALDRGRDTVAAILSQQRRNGVIEVVCRKTVNGRSWPEVKYQAVKNPPVPTPATNHGGAANKGVPLARKTERPERRSRSSHSGQFAGPITIPGYNWKGTRLG